MDDQSQDIESATTSIAAPDNKTRRYDRQLRLWAATGQAALESSRVLVLSGAATSTSILKNLVLPGIGHFTILDSKKVTYEDAGNNFFLDPLESVGKARADEAVRLLKELNDGVDGCATVTDLSTVLAESPSYITSFSLVIAHNLPTNLLDQLSNLLWSDMSFPPLIVIRSAGFIAEFFIQFHEHTIIESHPETAPSLRIDKPFPALFKHAAKLDFENMDVTEHGHIPYVVILVRAIEDWKSSHSGKVPATAAEKTDFKKYLISMKRKSDEENFDEAVSQAYRAWTETSVPADIQALFQDPGLTPSNLKPESAAFYHLLLALRQFTQQPPYTLPLTSTLPDMKADTTNYIQLQKLYKAQAEEEKLSLKTMLQSNGNDVEPSLLDAFVKNAHGLKILRGKSWASLDLDHAALADILARCPKEAAIHLGLSALFAYQASHPNSNPTRENLRAAVNETLSRASIAPVAELDDVIGELARSPTAELPNVAAFLGGLVAQEAIKMITKQYVPVSGLCVVDMVNSTTAVVFT